MGICPVVCCLGLSPDREITGKPQLGTQMVKSPGLDASRIKTYRAALKGNFTRAYVKESTINSSRGGSGGFKIFPTDSEVHPSHLDHVRGYHSLLTPPNAIWLRRTYF